MHVVGEGDAVERWGRGEPVGGGEKKEVAFRDAWAVDGDAAEGGEAFGGDLPDLARGGELGVNREAGGPEGGAGEEGLGKRRSRDSAHCFGDKVGLLVEGRGVLAEDAGDGGGGAVEEVVGGGCEARSAAVAGKVVSSGDGGCGDAGVGLVERESLEVCGGVRVGVREGAAEEAVLAIHVAGEGGPELACEVGVAGPAEMADGGFEKGEVHVGVGAGKVAV